MSDYIVLSQEEQDNIVVAFYLEQEREAFCHKLNINRYDNILASGVNGDWKNKITKLRQDTVARLNEVNSILEATKKQLPNQDRIKIAVDTIKLRKG